MDIPPIRTLQRLIAGLVVAATLVVAGPAGAQTEPAPGALQAAIGGFRGATGIDPLAGFTFQQDASLLFDIAPADLGPSDAAGLALSTSVNGGDRYVRATTAPTGWRALPTIGYGGLDQAYVGHAYVDGNPAATPAVAAVGGFSPFVAAGENPALPTTCDAGTRVQLLLETTVAVAGAPDTYRLAARTFVDTLAGTPTILRISTFGSASHPGAVTYDLSTAAGQTAAAAAIDAAYAAPLVDTTANWDAAFQDAAAGGADAVVLVAASSPSAHVGGSSGGGIDDVAYGIAAANLAKHPDRTLTGPHQRIIGIGVGEGISIPDLAAVSGPVKGVDYTTTATPTGLAAELEAVALGFCGSTSETAVPSTPSVVAPPVHHVHAILLPSPSVRGAAALYGLTGCTSRRVVVTRVTGRNIRRIEFVRDGVLVERIRVPSVAWHAFTLSTWVPAGDYQMHTVYARVRFAPGTSPVGKAMVQRFAHCRASAVTG
ncbi:MAG: hypothetical protein ACR2JV_04550 [Gaiellales bacterium]